MSASASANPLAERLRAASSLLSQAIGGRSPVCAAGHDAAVPAASTSATSHVPADLTSTVVAVPLALLQSVLGQLESCIAQADTSVVPSGEWAEKMKMQLRQKGTSMDWKCANVISAELNSLILLDPIPTSPRILRGAARRSVSARPRLSNAVRRRVQRDGRTARRTRARIHSDDRRAACHARLARSPAPCYPSSSAAACQY
jgi:hypothetical protein